MQETGHVKVTVELVHAHQSESAPADAVRRCSDDEDRLFNQVSGVIECLGGELAKELRGSEVAVSVNTGHGPEGRHAVITVYRLEEE